MTVCCRVSARPAASLASHACRRIIAQTGARNRSSTAVSGCDIGMPASCLIASAAPAAGRRRRSPRSAVMQADNSRALASNSLSPELTT